MLTFINFEITFCWLDVHNFKAQIEHLSNPMYVMPGRCFPANDQSDGA